MGKFFGAEIFTDLRRASNTTAIYELGSFLNIGGQGFTLDSDLSFNLDTDLDTGTKGPDEQYNVFAVEVLGVISLVGSLDPLPLGFPRYRKIGSVRTDGSSNLLYASSRDEGKAGDIKYSRLDAVDFIQQNGIGWILYDGSDITNKKLAGIIGQNTIEDARGIFMRAKNYDRADGNQNPDGDLPIGSIQGDQFRSHGHSYNAPGGGGPAGQASGFGIIGATTGAAGGNETRPRNITMNVFIKVD